MVYLISYIKGLCDYDIRKQLFLFPIEGSLAKRCCRSSLEGHAYLNGSQEVG